MSSLLPVLISNALAASVLAGAILILRRHLRRPPLVHALWLLVLLKLVTPPLFDVPIARFDPRENPGRDPRPRAATALGDAAEGVPLGSASATVLADLLADRRASLPPSHRGARWRPDWQLLALAVWAFGAGPPISSGRIRSASTKRRASSSRL